MSLRFGWITDEAGLDRLREPWEALAGEDLGPFRTWAWQARWWYHLGAGSGRALRVLVAHEGSDLVGILPMYAARNGPFRRCRLGLLADSVVGSDYLGMIARPDALPTLAERVAERLAEEFAGGLADRVELLDLADTDPLAGPLFEALCQRMSTVAREARYTCPYARLAGVTAEDYFASRPGGFGSQYLQRRRRLERSRGYRLEILAEPGAVSGGLEVLFRLHRARWLADGGSQAFPHERAERFHRAVARDLSREGWSRLAVLSVGGQPVAAGYGFSMGRTFAYYQAGHDPAWRSRSVGTVVLGALIERSIAEGLAEFDFLRGDEAYKAIWADAKRPTHAISAHRGTLPDRVADELRRWERRTRRALSTHLPGPTAAALRRWAG